MKRIVWIFLCLIIVCSCGSVSADGEGAYFQSREQVADAVLEYFSDPSFTGYTIGWYSYAETARMVNGAWHGYAFVVAQKEGHNVLYGFRSSGGSALRHFLTTDSAIPQGPGRFELLNADGQTIETYPSPSSSGANKRHTMSDAAIAIWFQVPGNEEYFNWGMNADCDSNGQWHVRWIHTNAFGTKYSQARLTGEEVTTYFELTPQGSAKGVLETNLRYFSWDAFPKSLEEAKEKLTNPPMIPNGELKARRVKFTGGKKYEVYSGPGANYLRANGGRASVSTNDWIQVFGSENGYILIQYDLSASRNRFGYIPQSALPGGAGVSPLSLAYTDAEILAKTILTDDPLGSQASLCPLDAGDAVKWLAAMGEWAYVEADSSGQPVRGFVRGSTVTRSVRKTVAGSFRNTLYSAQAVGEISYGSAVSAHISVTVNGPAGWSLSETDQVIGYSLYANNMLMTETKASIEKGDGVSVFSLAADLPTGTVVLGLCPIYGAGPAIAETIALALPD